MVWVVPQKKSHGDNEGFDRVLVDGAGDCKSDEIYCWMTCKSTKSIGCDPKFAKCIDSSNGKSWTPGTHCSTCAPKCNKCSKAVCAKLKTSAKCSTYTACCKWSLNKCVLA